MKLDQQPFEDGEYEKFYQDERTQRALVELDKLAKQLKTQYGLIGGLAAYLYTNRPPHDEPDIDIMVYGVEAARKFVKALTKVVGFTLKLLDDQEDAVFAHLRFERDIQIDILTSLDESAARPTTRIKGVEVEPVEVLIMEKLVRTTGADVRMALDLLAFANYSKDLMFDLGKQYGMISTLIEAKAFARRMAMDVVSKDDIEAMVNRLKDE